MNHTMLLRAILPDVLIDNFKATNNLEYLVLTSTLILYSIQMLLTAKIRKNIFLRSKTIDIFRKIPIFFRRIIVQFNPPKYWNRQKYKKQKLRVHVQKLFPTCTRKCAYV